MTAVTMNLGKNIGFAVAEFVVTPTLVFLSYGLVMREGGIEAVGLWSTLFAWLSLIRIGDPGLASATMRFVALHQEGNHKRDVRDVIETGVIANGVVFTVLALAGYLVVYALLGQLVPGAALDQARAVLPVMAAGLVVASVSGVVLGALQGLHLGFIRSQFAVCGGLVQLVAVVLLVPRLGLLGLAWAQVLQHCATALMGWLSVRRTAGIKTWLPQLFHWRTFRQMLGFSLSAQLASVSNGLFEPLAKILVSQVGGLAAQGLFELAYKTVWLARNAVIAGVAATVPAMTALYRRAPEEVLPIYRRAQRLGLFGVSALMAAVTLGSPGLSWVWTGAVHWDYSIFVAMLALGAIGSAAGAPAYGLAMVTGSMVGNISVNAGVLAFLILGGFNVSALPIHGLVGVIAMAMALGGVCIKQWNERLLPSEKKSLAVAS